MLGKKEIYNGKDNDNLWMLLSRLKDAGIKYQITRGMSHLPDVRTGAAAGRYGESVVDDHVMVYVKKADYEAARSLI